MGLWVQQVFRGSKGLLAHRGREAQWVHQDPLDLLDLQEPNSLQRWYYFTPTTNPQTVIKLKKEAISQFSGADKKPHGSPGFILRCNIRPFLFSGYGGIWEERHAHWNWSQRPTGQCESVCMWLCVSMCTLYFIYHFIYRKYFLFCFFQGPPGPQGPQVIYLWRF